MRKPLNIPQFVVGVLTFYIWVSASVNCLVLCKQRISLHLSVVIVSAIYIVRIKINVAVTFIHEPLDFQTQPMSQLFQATTVK